MNKDSLQLDMSKIYDMISGGLDCENCNYQCEISSDWSVDDDSLIKELSRAKWINSEANPISKNEKRGIEYLSKLDTSMDTRPATFVGLYNCYYHRKNETTVETDTDFEEKEVEDKDIKLQMNRDEFISFYKSALEGKKDKIKMPPLIVKCKPTQLPKCKDCNGSGIVRCRYCKGYGKGDCPDCGGYGELFSDGEMDKEYPFTSRVGYKIQTKLVKGQSNCKTCNGTGSFNCHVCGGSGEIKCTECDGSGIKNNAKRAQEVTRMTETYSVTKRCYILMPDQEEIELDTLFLDFDLRDIFVGTTPFIINKPTPQDTIFNAIRKNVDNNCPDKVIKELSEDPNLFALNVKSYKIDRICTIIFTFKSEEYKIVVIGNKAFSENLPKITFVERLLGKYK